MLALTGAAGFIAHNLAPRLLARGAPLLAVDVPEKLERLEPSLGGEVDAIDPATFLRRLRQDAFAGLDAIIHLGARTDTTDPDDAGVLQANYTEAATLMDAALERGIRFIYASSAAVYGNAFDAQGLPEREAPLNVYGFSKWLLDRHAWRHQARGAPVQLAGIRPFNVYGPNEAAKGPMASMVHQLTEQLDREGRMRLFGAGEGCAAGEHRRDFVHVDDVCAVLEWLLDHPEASGTFDVGSGINRSFNELAHILSNAYGAGDIDYLPFPDGLRGRYQVATCANLSPLRSVGYDLPFTSLEDGVVRHLAWRGSDRRVAAAG